MKTENKAKWTQYQHVGEIIEESWNRVDAKQGKTCHIKEHDPFENMPTELIG